MRRDTGPGVRVSLTLWMYFQPTHNAYDSRPLETVSSFISKARGLGCRENSLQCDYSYPFVHLAICLSVGVAVSSTNEYAAGEVIPE